MKVPRFTKLLCLFF